jgi:hypothetical protein
MVNQDPNKWETNPYTSPEAMVQYFQKQVRELHDGMHELAREMTHLKGFYGWMIHAYPDTIAQYKAIQELQRASNEQSVGTATVPMYGFGGAVGKQP